MFFWMKAFGFERINLVSGMKMLFKNLLDSKKNLTDLFDYKKIDVFDKK